MDAVTHKTCGPDERRNQVSQRQQENTAQHLSVVEHAYRRVKNAHGRPKVNSNPAYPQRRASRMVRDQRS